MRIVIDTNVLVSALLVADSSAGKLLDYWQESRFELVSSHTQLDELSRVMRYPKISARLAPSMAGRMINEIRKLAILIETLPKLDISPDPYDNYLLAIAQESAAHYLISGDKRDVLALGRHAGTKIVSVREFLSIIGP